MLATDLITVIITRLQAGYPTVHRQVKGVELMDESQPLTINRIIGELATELDAKAEDAMKPKP